MSRILLKIIVVIVVLSLNGCGRKGAGGGAAMVSDELGLRMNVPAGWQVDRKASLMCSKGDSTGIIISEDLEGKNFEEHVRQLSNDFNGKVVSSVPVSVSGFNGVRVVIEYPEIGSKSMKVYIHKEKKLIEISFVTPMEDFAGYEGSLLDSIESISLKGE
ncbi:MAG TPA: hypothetical protein PKN36_10480 [bacterium]|nr:hypothetical protein [bacterium]